MQPAKLIRHTAIDEVVSNAGDHASDDGGVDLGSQLDVFANEPNTDSPLFGMPGVLCTPHLGASTEEAQAQVAVEGVGLLVDFLTTGAIRHAVNMSPLDAKTLESLRGDLDVAHRLGLLLSQFDRTLLRAASSCGAGPVTAFRRVMLPVILPGVVAGAVFAFATSLDESVVVLFLAGPSQRTLPRQMFAGLKDTIELTILAAATMLVVLSLVLMLLVRSLSARGTARRP